MSAPDTFAELYSRHADAVFACVVSILRNRDEAQDVVQEVFLQAWRQAAAYRSSRGSVASWLNCIARSRAIDRLRRAGRAVHEARPASETTTAGDSLHSVVHREQIERLRMAWVRLTPANRRLLDLVYEEGMSHSAIATLLQQPVGTVKTRIRQAVKMLRRHIDQASVEKLRRPSNQDGDHSLPFTIMAEEKLVNLPLAEPTRQDRIGGHLVGLRVLVVDDDTEVLRLTSAVLRRFGAISLTCSSSRSALEEIDKSRSEVMIVDLAMPEEDGYSFLGRARAWAADRHRRIAPAAAFTSSASELERSRALIAGFDAYLTKPVHPLALLSAVAALSQREQPLMK